MMSKEPKSLNEFIDSNSKKTFVVVQGLGFVGAVMSIVVANSDNNQYAVIGVDLPSRQDIIDGFNSGLFPIQSSDDKVYEYFEEARRRNAFYATSDSSVYARADVVIVDINLDVAKSSNHEKELLSFRVDLSGFKAAIRSVASICKPNVLLLVETTVPPGTCQKVVAPIFRQEFDKRGLAHQFKIGHSYERVMPGPGYVDSIKNFYRVFSGIDEQSAKATEEFLHTVISTKEYPLTRLANTNATEMSKVLENSFRAMNIAFIQEWTGFAEAAGVDLYEVVNAIRMRPTHKNIMRPGLGVGGYCLTKDPLLASWASQELFSSGPLEQSERAVAINDKMPLHTFSVIKNMLGTLENKKILVLGVSYLQNVGDTRYTPVELLYDKLIEEGAQIVLHDPFVPFWEEKNLEIEKDIEVGEYDAIIIGTPHDYYLKKGILEAQLASQENTSVFDPHGCIPESLIKNFKNHSFTIIGKGNE